MIEFSNAAGPILTIFLLFRVFSSVIFLQGRFVIFFLWLSSRYGGDGRPRPGDAGTSASRQT